MAVCAGVWFFLLLSPALSSHHLLSPVIPPVAVVTASGRQTLPCHVGRLWCWSVLMEKALSLFVHLKHRHFTAPPGKGTVSYTDTHTQTDIFVLNISILLIFLWGFGSSCFSACSLYVQHFNTNISHQSTWPINNCLSWLKWWFMVKTKDPKASRTE